MSNVILDTTETIRVASSLVQGGKIPLTSAETANAIGFATATALKGFDEATQVT